ncbi:MAG: quinolinate synthase NadA [bacterium]
MGKEKLIEEIKSLAREKNAIIMAHNYQIAEVQDIADYRGDSLGLAQEASKTDADIIVLCGVYFMAETASIINPDKKVLIPREDAGCPMSDMITGEALRKKKAEHPEAKVVCYVNTTAEVKAESHICCTSSNAERVINSIPRDVPILFVPDRYLGGYIAKRTGRDNVILWNGFCPTHLRIRPEDILEAKRQYPEAEVVVHPECLLEVSDLADKVLSTGGMIKYIPTSKSKRIILGTEIGIVHALQKVAPDKEFIIPNENQICPNMKKNDLESIRDCLLKEEPVVKVEESIRIRAKEAIDRMLALG